MGRHKHISRCKRHLRTAGSLCARAPSGPPGIPVSYTPLTPGSSQAYNPRASIQAFQHLLKHKNHLQKQALAVHPPALPRVAHVTKSCVLYKTSFIKKKSTAASAPTSYNGVRSCRAQANRTESTDNRGAPRHVPGRRRPARIARCGPFFSPLPKPAMPQVNGLQNPDR